MPDYLGDDDNVPYLRSLLAALGGAGGAVATEATLLAVKNAITTMDLAVDNIDLSNAAIDMNTDELEDLIRALGNVSVVGAGSPIFPGTAQFYNGAIGTKSLDITGLDLTDTFVAGMSVTFNSPLNASTFTVLGVTSTTMTLSPSPVAEGPLGGVSMTPIGSVSELIVLLRNSLIELLAIRTSNESREFIQSVGFGISSSKGPIISPATVDALIQLPGQVSLGTSDPTIDFRTDFFVGYNANVAGTPGGTNDGIYNIASVGKTRFVIDTPSGTFSFIPTAGVTLRGEGISTNNQRLAEVIAELSDVLAELIAPTALSTSAAQTTANGILATIDVDTDAIATSVGSIDTDITSVIDNGGAEEVRVAVYSSPAYDSGSAYIVDQEQPVLTIGAAFTAATVTATAPLSGAVEDKVTVLADDTNTNTIWVGPSGVTVATGFPLVPGAAKDYKIDDLDKLFFISDAVSQTGRVGGS